MKHMYSQSNTSGVLFYRTLTRTMTSTRRVLLYVTPVLIVSFCLNIPKFMETQASSGSTDEQANGTSLDNTTETFSKIVSHII